MMADLLICGVIAGLVGIWLGRWGEAVRWRRAGKHEYIKRVDSGGKLYRVTIDEPSRHADPDNGEAWPWEGVA